MRAEPSILHLDLDAFFASVEQRDKPSLRGKPVIVGGTGGRGVVAAASYEARAFGVHSAMPTAQARRLCPNAAFLRGRFAAYSQTSKVVMDVLREFTPVVEPLSLDEAYLDLTAGDFASLDSQSVNEIGAELKEQVRRATGGLRASVGAGTSKLIAKIASDLDKPDGLVVVAPGMEQELLRPMPVSVIPGIGPATTQRLRQVGVQTVGDAERLDESELIQLLGQSHGAGLFQVVRAQDDRPVIAVREAKSISVEDTYETDHTDPAILGSLLERQARQVAQRLSNAHLSGRTISLKVRLHDFSTLTRSNTIPAPTDDPAVLSKVTRQLLSDIDTSGGVRLLGLGVSSLTDWVQEALFQDPVDDDSLPDAATVPAVRASRAWAPGMDVEHAVHGRGWVWGSGHSIVTVRFETASTGPGPIRSFVVSDADLHPVTLDQTSPDPEDLAAGPPSGS
ncbi:MAG: DNA polymerase IV [Marmoricola sp.]|nr:DNA polymerase IV [Marmoricola sp.]